MYLIKNKTRYQHCLELCDKPTEEQVIMIPPKPSSKKAMLTDEQVSYLQKRYGKLVLITKLS